MTSFIVQRYGVGLFALAVVVGAKTGKRYTQLTFILGLGLLSAWSEQRLRESTLQSRRKERPFPAVWVEGFIN